MKKLSSIVLLTCFLIACNDEAVTVEVVEKVDDDVAAVVAMTDTSTFASIIYSESAESYLILNIQGSATVTFESQETEGHIHIQYTKDNNALIEPVVFTFTLNDSFETIRLYENGEEIPFDIWTE